MIFAAICLCINNLNETQLNLTELVTTTNQKPLPLPTESKKQNIRNKKQPICFTQNIIYSSLFSYSSLWISVSSDR